MKSPSRTRKRTFKVWVPKYTVEALLSDLPPVGSSNLIFKRVPATRAMVGPLVRATLTLSPSRKGGK